LEIAAAIGILGNNFGAKLLEVEVCADRNMYHIYRFLLDFSQVITSYFVVSSCNNIFEHNNDYCCSLQALLALYTQSHILVFCGCSGMLFHVWIAAVMNRDHLSHSSFFLVKYSPSFFSSTNIPIGE
jgi:hypothetical protein